MTRRPDFRRLETVLRMEGEPDKVPFYEHLVDEEVISEVLGYDGPPGDLAGTVQRRMEFYGKLGYDYVPMEIQWPITRTNVVSGEDTAWIPRRERTWVDQRHGTIENRDDFDSYDWPSADYDYARPLEVLSRRLSEKMIIGHACGGVLENTMWLMGARFFSRALYEDRGLLRAIFDRVGRAIEVAFGQVADVPNVGALCLGDDMGLRTGTMISPKDLREFVFPWQRRICRKAHRRDLPFILHACGNLTQIMDDLIDFVGIDAKHSFEDAIMPVSDVKRRWGTRIAILGGVDVDVLARRDVDRVRRYVQGVMSECLPGAGWALGSGNSIPNYVKVENYLAMLDQGRGSGNYPI